MSDDKTIGEHVDKVVDRVSENVDKVKERIAAAKEDVSDILRDISEGVEKAADDSGNADSGLVHENK